VRVKTAVCRTIFWAHRQSL